jgi:hypothetical protein
MNTVLLASLASLATVNAQTLEILTGILIGYLIIYLYDLFNELKIDLFILRHRIKYSKYSKYSKR